MRLVAKILLWLLGSAAALVAAGIVFLLVFDWNLLRSAIGERAGAASGRDVEIRGDLNVDIWSWTPELVAHDVILGNPSWAEEPQMLRVAEVYLKLRVLPLFAGRLEVERLRLVAPQLALERREGKANWDLGAETPGTAAVEAAAPKEREDFPVLKRLVVEQARLTYRDPDLERPIEVALDSLSIEAGGLEDPVRLQAEGSYLEKPFRLLGTGDSFERFRSAEEAYGVKLEGRIGNTQLTAEGGIAAPLEFAGIDATLDVKGDSLQELHTVFGLPLPDSPPYALSGRLIGKNERWELHGFDGRLGDSDLRGDLAVTTGGARPRLVADARSEAFRIEDIEVFWGGEGEEAQQEQNPAAAGDDHVLPDEPLALPKLRRMDAEVRFQGKSVTSGELRLQDLSTDLRLEDGLLTLQPLELGLAEGRIAADLRLDGRQEVPQMGGELRVDGLDIGALLALLGEEGAGTGLLRGRLELSMQGRSLRELGASADGEGALIMSGGQLENILLELVALDLQEAAGQWLTNEEEQVEVLCLAMPTQIRNGRFEAQPWILDTTDAIVTITGSVDLGSERVDVELEPHPKDFSLFNFLTSIEITGDLSKRNATANPLEAAAKVVLKTIAAPIMPLLSGEIQEQAQQQSVPCPELRQRLEAAMAEGEVGVEDAEAEGDSDPETAKDGDTIARVQQALNEAGFDLAVDGILGPNTRAALRDFQRRHHLPPDGRPDARTLRQLGLER